MTDVQINNFDEANNNVKRLYNLDYLRGIAAFGIMLYHYLMWTYYGFSAGEFMGRVGVYGVSVFYVLSGLTLYYVYIDKMKPSKMDVLSFVKKRILRIFPLLWMVTIIAILLSQKSPNPYDLFLNLTGLFGFLKWDTYFSTGMWSIGNELVFYVFFPFFILFTKHSKVVMALTVAIILLFYLYFTFVKLTPALTLSDQWKDYVNPLNQVFLFLGGFLTGVFFSNTQVKSSINILLLFCGFCLFVFYPASGNLINIVTGLNRLVLTASCFLICFCFYKLSVKLPDIIHKPLALLGEASYSVYLLHPLVFITLGFLSPYFKAHIFNVSPTIWLAFSVLITLVISYFVYNYFEKYFMKLGKINNKAVSA